MAEIPGVLLKSARHQETFSRKGTGKKAPLEAAGWILQALSSIFFKKIFVFVPLALSFHFFQRIFVLVPLPPEKIGSR